MELGFLHGLQLQLRLAHMVLPCVGYLEFFASHPWWALWWSTLAVSLCCTWAQVPPPPFLLIAFRVFSLGTNFEATVCETATDVTVQFSHINASVSVLNCQKDLSSCLIFSTGDEFPGWITTLELKIKIFSPSGENLTFLLCFFIVAVGSLLRSRMLGPYLIVFSSHWEWVPTGPLPAYEWSRTSVRPSLHCRAETWNAHIPSSFSQCSVLSGRRYGGIRLL